MNGFELLQQQNDQQATVAGNNATRAPQEIFLDDTFNEINRLQCLQHAVFSIYRIFPVSKSTIGHLLNLICKAHDFRIEKIFEILHQGAAILLFPNQLLLTFICNAQRDV